MEKIVTAKCVTCDHQQKLKAGQEPVCEKCMSPMIAIKAEFCEDFI